jgi:GT2 family glycosyltransferase
MNTPTHPVAIGVVIVTYNSEDVILGCLRSLMAAPVPLRIVVVDNASDDATCPRLRAWAAGRQPVDLPPGLPFVLPAPPACVPLAEGTARDLPAVAAPGTVSLLHSGANRGFAGGVNLGLAQLARDPSITHFWVLNPDSVVPPESVVALAADLATGGAFALLGGRVNYLEQPDRIQVDGGTLNRLTGVTGNIHLHRRHADTPPPDVAQIDFIMGASMVASRAFYDAVGPMREDYFLYYEEVDWALRRGALPLRYCPGLVVYHWAGASIGSPAPGRRASAFSLYFKHRSRMMFLRRFQPWSMPVGLLYALAKAAQIAGQGDRAGAGALLRGAFGLAPPRAVQARLDRAGPPRAQTPAA